MAFVTPEMMGALPSVSLCTSWVASSRLLSLNLFLASSSRASLNCSNVMVLQDLPLILLKMMSMSVTVMFLPSITWQSLHSLDQFLPCISLQVALVYQRTVNLLQGAGLQAVVAPLSLASSNSSDSLLAALSFVGSPGDLGGVLLAGLGGLGLL
ncbi:hypothetical protein DBR06_SOUSAS1310005, partial [Sousa chinensis]